MVFSIFIDVCNHPCNQFWNIFFISEGNLVPFSHYLPHSLASLPQPEATTNLLSVSTISLFWTCHANRIMLYLVFVTTFSLHVSKVHLHCINSMHQYCITFSVQIIFHFIATSHFEHPLVRWWFGLFQEPFGLFLHFGYYEKCCLEHSCISSCVDIICCYNFCFHL